MTDIYDQAIEATLKVEDIHQAWLGGANPVRTGVPLHSLLFKSCKYLECCLTEFKNNMGDPQRPEEIGLYEDLLEDDLIPLNEHDLELVWHNSDEIDRRAILEQFAMYNRRLDKMFNRPLMEY